MPFISDLDEDYPDGDAHAGSVLDDDIRGIKAIILDTFPNVTGAVTADQDALNRVAGVNSNIQDQLNNEDDGFTALSEQSYIISGTCSSQVVSGPYGYPAMLNTWGVAASAPGVLTVVHNMDVLLGISVTDYVPIITPLYTSSGVYPVVGVNPSNGSFEVHQYDLVADEPVTPTFHFQIVLNL